MNNILVLLVIGVASLAIWIRIRKNIQGDHTQPWFTFLQTKETDPHTWWFDLLRQIEGEPMVDSGSASNANLVVTPPVTTPVPNTTTTATPTNTRTVMYLQWSANVLSSILRPDGMTPSINIGNEVGWWEPVRQANVVNTFAVNGNDTVTLDAIPRVLIGIVSLPIAVDSHNVPVIRLPVNAFLVLPHETPSMKSCCLFLVMQWETEVVGTEELMGQMYIGPANTVNVGLVLADVIANKSPPTQTPPTHTTKRVLVDVNQTITQSTQKNLVGLPTTDLSESTLPLTKMNIIGLQILDASIRFIDSTGKATEKATAVGSKFPPTTIVQTQSMGMYIGSKISQSRNARYIYEIRRYPLLLSLEDMTGIWKELQAQYNTV